MIEENPENDLLIKLYESFCVLWNRSSESFVYKPDDNYFREKLDMQRVTYEHVAGMLKYKLPKFRILESGRAFLREHYHVSDERYAELVEMIKRDPLKSYAPLVSLFAHFDAKCTYLEYQHTW